MGSIARKTTDKGMILGFQPLNMVFENICYSVDLPSVSLYPVPSLTLILDDQWLKLAVLGRTLLSDNACAFAQEHSSVE